MKTEVLEVVKVFPRGFCAGVDRAVQMVERALAKFGAPVYVHHDIVHNTFVVNSLKAKGVTFVEDIDQVPEGVPVIFSAHGVPEKVVEQARSRDLFYIDATCPLVSKVHAQVRHFFQAGFEIVLIGHQGHPEVVGTLGQIPKAAITLIESVEDAHNFQPRGEKLGCVTQTTLSVLEASAIIEILKARFPDLALPAKQDICYATTNRQDAVKAVAHACDLFLVIGSSYSSNSQRLLEVALASGCPQAFLIDSYRNIDWNWLKGKKCLGLTSGASAPEELLQEVMKELSVRFPLKIREFSLREENITFNIPKILL